MAEKPMRPNKGEERFEVVYEQKGPVWNPGAQIWVDKKTGVNYIFVSAGSSGGLTPLLDEEGKPIVTPID